MVRIKKMIQTYFTVTYFIECKCRWIISVIHGAKVTKFGTHVVEDYLEGTISQFFFIQGLVFIL